MNITTFKIIARRKSQVYTKELQNKSVTVKEKKKD